MRNKAKRSGLYHCSTGRGLKIQLATLSSCFNFTVPYFAANKIQYEYLPEQRKLNF